MSTAARALACLLFLVAPLAVLQLVLADSDPAPRSPSILSTLTVKQLRAAIASRGLVCTSCTEKQHLVEFLQEHIDALPLDADTTRSTAAGGTIAAGSSQSAQPNHHQKPSHPTREELLQQLRNQQPGFGAPKDESPAEAIMRRMQEQMNANNGFFDASKLDLSGIKADVKATPKTRQPKGEL